MDGVAGNPTLPTPLLLSLLRAGAGDAGEGGGGAGVRDGVGARGAESPAPVDRPPRRAVQRAGLPEAAVALILAHPDPRVRMDFALSADVEPARRARLADDPVPKVRAALAYGPEWHAPRTSVPALPDAVCARLLDDPEPSVREALLDSPHLTVPFRASLATHHDPAARLSAVLRGWERLAPGERAALSADPDPGVRRAAALRECPRDARLTTELLRDPRSAAEALRHGLLTRADAERYVAGRTHLVALAENPSLPRDLVDRLAVDPDEDVRLAVSIRPELSEERRRAIDFTVGALDRRGVQWVQDGLADPDVLRRAATSGHLMLQRAAARSPHLPPDLLRLLVRAEDPVVETNLCVHHPDTPQDVMMRVYGRLGGTFSAWMAETHPRFPREGLAARYADHPDGDHRRLALRDPAATPALVERLSHDPVLRTRQAAAGDPRLPLHRLREVLHVHELASAAGANPALPVDDMAAVLSRAGLRA
ncbi:Mucin-2 [Streptomyces sp. NPDC057939]|uniref:Mucin-2 n=1 Tax=Streptomyces sp. NPDC057939 TaxID=3346284 RepID=UPI0036E08FAE